MDSDFRPAEVLVDRGFDAEFSQARIAELCALFARDERVQDFIYEMHERDNALDLKRGEFYPEILRATISLKRAVGAAYGLDLTQVHPNFGSNGSIDTIIAAAKTVESERLAAAATRRLELLRKAAEVGDSGELSRLLAAGVPLDVNQGVMFTSPTYFRNYNSAAAKQFVIHKVPLRDDYGFDAPAFIEAMQRVRPTLVLLVTPNNPTGLPVADADLQAVLEALPADTWAVIDRTLVNTRPEISTRELLERYSDRCLIVLHSFSKYQGMSHHRIGVALHANAATARAVQPHLPLGLNLEGCLKATNCVLRDGGIVPSAAIRHYIDTNREALRTFCRDHSGFCCTDFAGNYCLLGLPAPLTAARATAALEAQGLFVMGGHEFPEPNEGVLRLHTGSPPAYIQKLCGVLAAL